MEAPSKKKAQIKKTEIGKILFTLRCSQGLTQAQVAAKLGRTQGWVSKMEHSDLDSIRMGDLLAYTSALGYSMGIFFQKGSMSAVECVKFHAFQIKKQLDFLAELTTQSRDDNILEGVTSFYKEYLYNILRLFQKSASLLPEQKELSLQICTDLDLETEDDDPEPKAEINSESAAPTPV